MRSPIGIGSSGESRPRRAGRSRRRRRRGGRSRGRRRVARRPRSATLPNATATIPNGYFTPALREPGTPRSSARARRARDHRARATRAARSRVCWPRRGPGRRTKPGVFVMRCGDWKISITPRSGWSTSTAAPGVAAAADLARRLHCRTPRRRPDRRSAGSARRYAATARSTMRPLRRASSARRASTSATSWTSRSLRSSTPQSVDQSDRSSSSIASQRSCPWQA